MGNSAIVGAGFMWLHSEFEESAMSTYHSRTPEAGPSGTRYGFHRLCVILSGAAILLVTGLAAEAQSRRCRITDPTGTPLNIRATPGGEVVGQLPNGMLVNRAETIRDERGRAWVFLHDRASGDPIGWVYREFVACF
jgi:hypothetical protein